MVTDIQPAFCLLILLALVQGVSAYRGCPFLISTEMLNEWEGPWLPSPVSYSHDGGLGEGDWR